jgi:hypothetical protein
MSAIDPRLWRQATQGDTRYGAESIKLPLAVRTRTVDIRVIEDHRAASGSYNA